MKIFTIYKSPTKGTTLMNKILALCVCSIFINCVTIYKNRKEMPEKLQEDLKKVENYYIEEAIKLAAFSTGCNKDEITASILSTSKEQFKITQNRNVFIYPAYVQEEKYTKIGVIACGQRLIYHVLCGIDDEYAAPGFVKHPEKPCQIVTDDKAEIIKSEIEEEKEKRKRMQQQYQMQQQMQSQ